MPGEGDDKALDPHDASAEEGVWAYVRAEKASVIIDAADYFEHMQAAMLAARKRIFLIGWDFDTRIHLTAGRKWWRRPFDRSYPRRLGSFIGWLVRRHRDLDVRILKWTPTMFQYLTRGSMLWDILRWAWHERIKFKFDSAHPLGCSHHQKIAILDSKLAVCGGIDMTDKRWDTREHAENEPRRKGIAGKPYQPWHDATMMMEGPIAAKLTRLGARRWERAGGEELPDVAPSETSLWPEKLPVQFKDVELGIARTRAEYRECPQIREIEALFKRQICGAKRFIYAESQYFASRVVGEAILARLQQPDPPEIIVVHPANADGWLEQQAMDHARTLLYRTIHSADPMDRFTMWMPHTGETPIYVHAKILIVDDEIFRIGSANFNNRSMGLDSECDVFIDARRPGNEAAGEQIAALRRTLLAEHLGLSDEAIVEQLEKLGSMQAVIEANGDPKGRHLRRYTPPQASDTEKGLAASQLLDPEHPKDMFEPFAKGGLFREGSRLAAMRDRLRRRNKTMEKTQ